MGCTAQKMKFSIKDFSSKCNQIRSKTNGKLHFLCSGERKVVILRSVPNVFLNTVCIKKVLDVNEHKRTIGTLLDPESFFCIKL